jgi:hypothetical protein
MSSAMARSISPCIRSPREVEDPAVWQQLHDQRGHYDGDGVTVDAKGSPERRPDDSSEKRDVETR